MKNKISSFFKLQGLILCTSFIFLSCSHGREDKNYFGQKAESSEGAKAITDEQPVFKGDTNRTFIRKADLCFKVKDVKTSTFKIEQIVNANNGYVTTSNLESTINSKSSVRTSKDSVMDVINYTVQSNIVVRIPNEDLDETLAEISGLIDYLDYRRINAEDVTSQFEYGALAEKRYAKHTNRLEKAIDQKGKKLTQLVEAENNLLDKQQGVDALQINSNELAYGVKYSTIAINVYQKEYIKKEVSAYFVPVEPYKPSFGSDLKIATSAGLVVFEELILFFIKLWPIALLVTGFVFIFKRIRKFKIFGN